MPPVPPPVPQGFLLFASCCCFLSNGARSPSLLAAAAVALCTCALLAGERALLPFGTGVFAPLGTLRSGNPPPRTRTLSNPEVTWCCSGGMTGVELRAVVVLLDEAVLVPLLFPPRGSLAAFGGRSVVFARRAWRRRSMTPARRIERDQYRKVWILAHVEATGLTCDERSEFALLRRLAILRTDNARLGVDVLDEEYVGISKRFAGVSETFRRNSQCRGPSRR